MASIWLDAQTGKLTKGLLLDYLEQDPGLLDREDSSGITPLGYALIYGKASVVKLLLDNNVDPDKRMGETIAMPEERTPMYLAVTAKPPNPRLVQLLLEKKPKTFDDPIPSKKNETPLMAAVTLAKNPEIVKQLVAAGASLEEKNRDDKTAQDLADQLSDETKKKQIKDALVPTLKGGGGLRAYISQWALGVLSHFNAWKTLGSIFKAATRYFYGVASSDGLHPEEDEEVDEPKTAADFKNNLDKVVSGEGLERFFPPGNTYIKEVAEKAALLKDDPNNLLNSPSQLQGLATLALYQPVLYCDDSGSMNGEGRWSKQKELVKRITNITNRAVPGNRGVYLRLINTDAPDANNLDGDAVARRLNFTPNGSTPIGTKLRQRILEPLIYSVINAGKKLERPYLILIITDGCPWEEPNDALRNSILECSEFLEKNDHRKDAVRFCLSQVGTDDEAKEFMNDLDMDDKVLEVLYRTAELIDARYDDLRHNENELENWLLTMLLSPVKFLSAP